MQVDPNMRVTWMYIIPMCIIIIYYAKYNTVLLRKRAHYGMSAHPPIWALFSAKVECLLKYAPMRSCPWKRSSNAWNSWTVLRVRSISNVLNSPKLSLASFMPRFSTKKQSYTTSNCSHTHLIWLQWTIHSEVSWPPLLWIGNRTWNQ